MAVRKFKFIFLLLVSSCVTASDTGSVNIDNQLSECIIPTDIKMSSEAKIPILSFYLQMNGSLAKCGCKSALGAYTVFAEMEDYKSYVIGGKVAFAKSEYKYLPLSAEHSLVDKKKLIVSLSCAQPD